MGERKNIRGCSDDDFVGVVVDDIILIICVVVDDIINTNNIVVAIRGQRRGRIRTVDRRREGGHSSRSSSIERIGGGRSTHAMTKERDRVVESIVAGR